MEDALDYGPRLRFAFTCMKLNKHKGNSSASKPDDIQADMGVLLHLIAVIRWTIKNIQKVELIDRLDY